MPAQRRLHFVRICKRCQRKANIIAGSDRLANNETIINTYRAQMETMPAKSNILFVCFFGDACDENQIQWFHLR